MSRAERIARASELRRQSRSVREIADEIGLSHGRVAEMLSRERCCAPISPGLRKLAQFDPLARRLVEERS